MAIKLFHAFDEPVKDIESKVNNWLKKYHDVLVVRDIKFQSYSIPRQEHYHECTDIMIVYEVIPK